MKNRHEDSDTIDNALGIAFGVALLIALPALFEGWSNWWAAPLGVVFLLMIANHERHAKK